MGTLAVSLFLSGCGGSDATNELSSALPSLALTSPTAPDSSDSSLMGSLASALKLRPTHDEPLSNYKDFSEEINTILTESTVEECLEHVHFGDSSPTVSCYGPELFFTGHGADNSSGSLPSGDLGLWVATNSSDGEACTATKMNASIQSAANLVNGSITLVAALLCVANVKAQKLPNIGEDALELKSFINGNLTGAALSTASITRLEDNGANKVYKTIVEGTVSGPDGTDDAPLYISLTHSPLDSTNSSFEGRLQSAFEVGFPTKKKAYSVIYKKSGGTLYYTAKELTAPAGHALTEYFNSSNEADLSMANFSAGDNPTASYTRAQLTTETNLGTVYYAWQAGYSDGYSRVFRATTRSSSDSDTGVGYFGFGPDLRTATSSTLGSISGMICNWAGPAPNKVLIANITQAQTMSRNDAGLFVPDDNYIKYAPLNSCDYDGSTNNWSWSTTSLATVSDVPSISNELVSYGSVGTVDSISEPTLSF